MAAFSVSELMFVGLQDDIEAYKTQNKFLNSEIYQLTKLWRKSSEQEKSLMVKVGQTLQRGDGSKRSASVLLFLRLCPSVF